MEATQEVNDIVEGSVVDQAYIDTFGTGIEDVEEPERQVGSRPVPNFGYYVVQFEGHKVKKTKAEGMPYISPTVRIVEGPRGTVNRVVFGSLTLFNSRTKRDVDESGKPFRRPKSDEEMKSAKNFITQSLVKVANRCGFVHPYPAGKTDDDIKAYGAQFNKDIGLCVVEIRKRGNFNDVNWMSLAHETDPVKDDSGNIIDGKTALDDARERIAKFDANASGGPVSGNAAGVGAAPQPSPFD